MTVIHLWFMFTARHTSPLLSAVIVCVSVCLSVTPDVILTKESLIVPVPLIRGITTVVVCLCNVCGSHQTGWSALIASVLLSRVDRRRWPHCLCDPRTIISCWLGSILYRTRNVAQTSPQSSHYISIACNWLQIYCIAESINRMCWNTYI